jgi:hypothetical protein
MQEGRKGEYKGRTWSMAAPTAPLSAPAHRSTSFASD